jgi:hypothetical protein
VTFGKDADRLFQQHRKRPASKDTIYTLFPRERFALRELVESRKAFQADLYQGHFERGGKVLIRDVTVRLIQTVHWHEFDPAATRPDAARYIVFGEAEEPYLAHEITIAPNYDQILRVIALPPERFPEGATVVLPKRDDWAGIHEGNRISSVIEQRSDSAERVSRLKVLSEYYLEEGELSFTRLSK